jgi:DNA-directed RNA polymerase subunit RPC12/RpoP
MDLYILWTITVIILIILIRIYNWIVESKNNVNNNLKSYTKDSNIQCYNCGYKILYKKRDKTPLLYIAE